MLKRQRYIFSKVAIVLDLAITTLSFVAAYYIRAGISTLPGLFSFSYYAWMLVIVLFLWGWEHFKVLLFPIAFLLFMIPEIICLTPARGCIWNGVTNSLDRFCAVPILSCALSGDSNTFTPGNAPQFLSVHWK